MTIIEALQTTDLRISNGWRFLLGDGKGGWIVRERKEKERTSRTIIETNDEVLAVQKLLES